MPKPSQSSDFENSPDQGERKQRRRGLSGASLESVAPKKRREFVPAERLRLLNAADAAARGAAAGRVELKE